MNKNANQLQRDLDLDPEIRELESDFQLWKAAFRDELTAHLAALQCDNDLFGFALEPAEDLGNLHFITCVGRESALEDRDSLPQRFSHVEWRGFLPPKDFEKSLQYLEDIGKKYHDLFIDSAYSEDTKVGAAFRRRLYSEMLEAMLECDRRGDFRNIWFKIISFSDFNHSIQLRSFLRLNCNWRFLTNCVCLVSKRLGSFMGKIGRRVGEH
ncbi:hypothetical protein RMSM_01566 [Rhodopirellula maiorica SM1]|uniref:Uncharacterized protein n=1 Tax=Rhodopirellula maiorica SM1 TaxID=1265738 RepID=M5RQD5_9BACT|nr:hypothetical protein [Rhodopirellula maiorica]EMI21505.1 hypothetical protein RMSM_01566 [Rhodopirellula maiorica SM1]